MTALDTDGWKLILSNLELGCIDLLAASAFREHSAGTRCLLDLPAVDEASRALLNQLIQTGHLPPLAVAIQAIAFDKSGITNWKVPWHQDLMFPFARRVQSPGFNLPTVKDGVDYARPPQEVLEHLLAVRLHLDDCGHDNGPLRVSPGTHRYGILPSSEVADYVSRHGEASCTARKGDALLMKPLILHASSRATNPSRRRVLHFVYHSGAPIAERWHRAIGLENLATTHG